jgi:hypothetical protein
MNIFLCLLVLLALAGVFWFFSKTVVSAIQRVVAYVQTATTWLSSKTPRMIEWWLIAALLCGVIFKLAPQQLPVSVYKISLIAIAGVVGYWLDRSLFPYARPDSFQGSEVERESGGEEALCFELDYEPPNDMLFAVSMVRRALIVAAAMIAVGLGA